jgi:hypothetical protein
MEFCQAIVRQRSVLYNIGVSQMHKYLVEEINNGFVIRGRPHPLDVPGNPAWLVELADEYRRDRRTPVTVVGKKACLETEPTGAQFCFCDFYGLVEYVAGVLLSSWVPPDRPKPEWVEEDTDYEPGWVRDWAINPTALR